MKAVELFTALWAIPSVLFLAQWMLRSIHLYYCLGVEDATRAFWGAFFPTAGVDPSVYAALGIWISGLYGERYTNFRFHVLVSTIMASIIVMNMTPFIRRQSLRLHRTLGFVFLALFVPFMLELMFTLMIRGMLPMGATVIYFNHVVLWTLFCCVPLGWYYARTRQIGKHRVAMTFVAAAFLLNPCQRFWMTVFGKLGYRMPYPTLQDFFEGPTRASEVAGFCSTYGMALLYVLVLDPLPKAAPRPPPKEEAQPLTLALVDPESPSAPVPYPPMGH